VRKAEAGSGRRFGKIRFEADPVVTRIVEAWPKVFLAERARGPGLNPDERIERIVEQYVESAQGRVG
jgi:hypothetical protein